MKSRREQAAQQRFLGYNPLPPGRTWPERLVSGRKALGISQKESARRIGVDPCRGASCCMFFRTPFSASATTACSVIVIARNTWPAAENCWLCFRQSQNPLANSVNAASNSLGSIRSSAPNAIVARWYASPPFPSSHSPQPRTPHEQCTHTPAPISN